MNMLSVLAPTSRPIEPLDPVTNVETEVAVRAAVKVLQVQRDAGKEIVRLLDSNVGTRLNRSA
jgi:hypothetical protein